MWLLPAFSVVARLAMRTYYRLEVDGGSVPRAGAALLVANHPNSLLDPALVVAVAGRPVRFLAKAPLFSDRLIGWLVRGAGAIPVHRRQDDATLMQQNADAFAAAHAALADGAAVGIFPEGLSHDEPALAPLRTGAARIALGAAQRTGAAIPIIPIGLTFRRKEEFRSDALVLVGEAVTWDDLAGSGDQHDAVRDLTARIDAALRSVTINLERWEDAPLIDAAEAIHAAEYSSDASQSARIDRIRSGTARLAALRRTGDGEYLRLARDVTRHRRILHRLGMTPADLHGDPEYVDAAKWTVRSIPRLTTLAIVGGVVGGVLFWVPYRLTGVAERIAGTDLNVRSTTKVLAGALLHIAWIAAIAGVVAWSSGIRAGVATALALPAIGMAALFFHDRWDGTRRDIRRFILKRTRRQLIAELRTRQRNLATRIDDLMRVPIRG